MPKHVGIYEIEKTLGEGTFGKVKQARNTKTGERVAIKVLDKEKIQKENMGSQVKREISIMKMIRHPNIVRLYEVLASKAKIFIVLELVTGGEIFDRIVSSQKLDEKTARFYFQQVCVAVHYCHVQGVCHRDLKPENLLLDCNGNLKISDFGLSNIFEQNDGEKRYLVTTCGTPNYVAPEVINDKTKGYDGAAADTWSLGIILFVFLAGYLPFDEQTLAALFQKIERSDYHFPEWFSEPVKDLIRKILVPDPQKRLSIPQIARHPWWLVDGPHKDAASELDNMKYALKAPEPGMEDAVQQMETDPQLNERSSTISNSAPAQQQQKMPQNSMAIDGANSSHHSFGSNQPQSAMQQQMNMQQQNMMGGQPRPQMGMYQPNFQQQQQQQQQFGNYGMNQMPGTPGYGFSNQGQFNAMQPNYFQQNQFQQPQAAIQQTNAFEIIDLATGGPYSSIVGDQRQSLQYLTKLAPNEVMTMVKASCKSIEGFIKDEATGQGSKLLVDFNMGRGIVQIKVSIKLAASNPPLYLLIIKKTGGDSSTFDQVCQKLQALGEFLFRTG